MLSQLHGSLFPTSLSLSSPTHIFGCVLEKFLPFPFRLGKKFVASQTRLTTRAAKHNEKY